MPIAKFRPKLCVQCMFDVENVQRCGALIGWLWHVQPQVFQKAKNMWAVVGQARLQANLLLQTDPATAVEEPDSRCCGPLRVWVRTGQS